MITGVSVLGEGTPAFAVSKDNDGKVTITIKEFSAIDALNKELGRIGVSKPFHGGGTEPTWTLTLLVRGQLPGCLLSPA
ncbi:hypothetical protein [Crossiella sp. CA198]|uniref:hypothetical protein n=1 Tax=Crossiella sp. CA198 TaxID=3455607 RepID=UPI003F8D4DD3